MFPSILSHEPCGLVPRSPTRGGPLAGWLLAVACGFSGCGGGGDASDAAQRATLDTTALSSDDAVAAEAAAWHGAPGENEAVRLRLVGDRASPALVRALNARGFSGVDLEGL